MSSPSKASTSVEKISRERIEGFEDRITDWLNANVPGYEDARVTGVEAPTSNGLSGETYIVATERQAALPHAQGKLVLRKDIEGNQTNPQANFENLVRLQTVLGEDGTLPVPRVLGTESSPESIGAPFFVMEFVEGRIPSDVPSYADSGWVRDATAEQRREMWNCGIDFLVRLHKFDWRPHSLDSLRLDIEGDDDVERLLNHAVSMFQKESAGFLSPVCEEAISWLRSNRPTAQGECVCWGDARIGNIIWRDFEIGAVVDWEMSTLGCPAMDLGWWSFFHRWSTVGQGFPELAGMCAGQELAELYEARGGDRIDDFVYYELLATVRGLSIWLGVFKAMMPDGRIADALHESVHMIQVVKTLLNETA